MYQINKAFSRVKRLILYKQASFGNQKHDLSKDYYKVLNVDVSSDPQEIKQQYYQLAKKYHPDMNKGDDSMFKAISEAYEILGDESNKKEYDNHNSSSSSSYTSTSGSKYAYNYEQRNSRYNNYGSTKYDHFKNQRQRVYQDTGSNHYQSSYRENQYNPFFDDYIKNKQKKEEDQEQRADQFYQQHVKTNLNNKFMIQIMLFPAVLVVLSFGMQKLAEIQIKKNKNEFIIYDGDKDDLYVVDSKTLDRMQSKQFKNLNDLSEQQQQQMINQEKIKRKRYLQWQETQEKLKTQQEKTQ